MESILKDTLRKSFNLKDDYTNWKFEDHTDDPSSFIHKVGVCCAIDSNKSDWVFIAIGVQRSLNSEVEVKGVINFKGGENDDPGNVLRRAHICLERASILFEDIFNII